MARTHAEETRPKRSDAAAALPAPSTLGPGLAGTPFDPRLVAGGLEPLLHASNRLIGAWMAVGTEILEFSKTRLDRSLEAGKAMARSGTLDEALDLQASYTRSALQDYLAEAGKIADIGTRSFLDSLTAWQSGTEPADRQAAEAVETAARTATATTEQAAAE